MQNEQYSHIAGIYNHLMRSVDYDDWAVYLIKLCERLNIDKSTILELAGGTCRLSERLYQSYGNIIVTDFSLPMLKISSENKLSKVCCNMLNLPFKNEFSFIFSTFDSINYLTHKTQLKSLFNSIHTILTEEGTFTFDVSLEQNSIKHERFLNRKGKFEGIRYKQRSIYKKSNRMHYNFFKLEMENGESFEEIHKQRIYEFEYYFQVITECGMFVSDCFDAFTFDDANENSERIQFVVKRIN
jgi:ubiquinone/menaquinone biosynthesis C-methylase UbiE